MSKNPVASTTPSRSQVQAASHRIDGLVRRTPVLTLPAHDLGVDAEITLKLESFQHTGSYKPRGVFNRLLARGDVGPGDTVVAASGGNHGIAVAHAARRLGFRAHIFVPEITAKAKIDVIRSYGADVTVTGAVYADALDASKQYAEATGARTIHAFDEIELIIGQGTIGRELSEQAPQLETVLVAAGGGSLLAGVAAWFAGSGVQVIGVEPERACAVGQAISAGRPVDVDVGGVAADSLGARRVGEWTFPVIRDHVSTMLRVTDEQILEAQRLLWRRMRLVTEPGGATAIAALLSAQYVPKAGERVGIVICGANTHPDSVAMS
ncbi:threonine/serine dehydratase [Paraburkholderia aspalathi]|uniref:threonine/serine dehydratase n=1 Tax=Paraburkholderia aspalathi TaxID=1324617 RepID=UPI0038BC6B94